MKHKPDAYELEYCGRGDNVVKCEACGFRAVKCQFDEEGCCPSCRDDGATIVKGKVQKSGNKKPRGA